MRPTLRRSYGLAQRGVEAAWPLLVGTVADLGVGRGVFVKFKSIFEGPVSTPSGRRKH